MSRKFWKHRSAEVSPKANVGAGTKIWNGAQVREEAIIGENCVISKDAYIDKGVVIGDRVKVQNGVSVYAGVTVEEEAFLGPHCVFTNDLRPRASSRSWKVVPTVVRRGATIGAGAVIVCGTTIGKYALVAAGAVVTKDVPAHALVMGNPARVRGYVCRCGAAIKGKSALSCPSCAAAATGSRRKP